jgi:hypothetical protein
MARVVCCAAPWSVQSTTHVHYRTASQGRAHVLSRVKATALTLRPSTSSAQKRVVRTAAGTIWGGGVLCASTHDPPAPAHILARYGDAVLEKATWPKP